MAEIEGFHDKNPDALAQMHTADLEALLLQDFQISDDGDSDMDEIFRIAQALAEREDALPAGSGAEQAWEVFLEKYLPFAGSGDSLYSLYEDDEARSAGAVQPQPFARAEERRPFRRPLRRRLLRAAACFLAVIVLGGGLALAFSAEAREGLSGWVREIYESCFVYRYHASGVEPAPDPPFDVPIYRPSWLPAGYALDDVPVFSGQVVLVYTDGTDILILQYMPAAASGVYVLDDSPEHVAVNGAHADLYPAKTENEVDTLIWSDRGSGMIFTLSARLSAEDMIRVAESLEAVQPVYRPMSVPTGYQVFYEDDSPDSSPSGTTIVYTHESRDRLTFRCKTVGMLQISDIEDAEVKQVQVRDCPADLYLDSREGFNSCLVWTDSEKGLIFWISGPLSEEELLEMAESIQPMLPEQTLHYPTWLPRGYTRNGRSGGGTKIQLTYTGRDGSTLTYRYTLKEWSEELVAELEEVTAGLESRSLAVGQYDARLYERPNGIRDLAWNDGSGGLCWISGPLSEEELVHMAESVKTEASFP